MKYRYFVSYIRNIKDNISIGRCTISMENEVKSIDDIECIEETLKEYDDADSLYRIINFKLMGSFEDTIKDITI